MGVDHSQKVEGRAGGGGGGATGISEQVQLPGLEQETAAGGIGSFSKGSKVEQEAEEGVLQELGAGAASWVGTGICSRRDWSLKRVEGGSRRRRRGCYRNFGRRSFWDIRNIIYWIDTPPQQLYYL